MGSIRQNILQTRISELSGRLERLTQKLAALQPARDRETDPGNKFRLDAIIAETEAERRQVEIDLIAREEELNNMQFSNSTPVPSPSDPTSPPRPLATDPIEVFYSYSHKDEELRERLETHLALLKRQGVIDDWHDRRIGAGTEWAGQIDRYLKSSQIILLLISADFLASNYCWDIEMTQALERHEKGDARVIPIILRSVDLTGAPFSKLQALPKDAKPVNTWSDQDAAFTNIAQGIRKVAEELRGKF